VNCPSCGHENRDAAKFCLGCGARFAGACSSCGAELPSGALFCDECGTEVGAAETRSPERDPRSYTPKHLAEKILSSKSAVEGERKQVTVLFADVQRSMDLQESIDPEEWHGVMDQFFRILADGVHRFEGTVNQYTGDGIMALFGAPISHEDHAQRACFAALHLTKRIEEYARDLKREKGLIFSVRMGLNSGEVVVGKIGDDLRMDYTAQGHTVSVASRMEQLAGPGKIYLTHATHALAEGYVDFEDLGEFTVRGISEPVRVYELLGTGPHRTRFDISQARGLSRFVGRGGEMRTLDGALARAIEGDAQIVGIVADAGVGKSRLCYEFGERCRGRSIPVRVGHAVAHGKSIPLLPITELLRDILDIHEQDDDQRARNKIAGALVLLEDQLTEAVPLYFELLGVPDPQRPAPPLEAETRQRQIFEIQRRLLKARSERSPAVILLEDLHWFDPESEAWLEQMAQAIHGTRTLLLLNFRPEFQSPWMGKSFYQQISLLPLGRDEIEELLRELLGDDPSLDGLRPLIFERTGGNPFFVEEVVRSLAESGSLDGTKGDYRLMRPLDALTIPPTVQAVLASRIDRLAEREKQVLQTAAVIGQEFPESVLRAVSDVPDTDLHDALGNLLEVELVHEAALYPDAVYAFKHPISRDVVYQSQLADRRIRIHEAVARAIEAAHPGRLDDQAALLAHHWEHAGNRLEAARWTRRAAERARTTETAASLRHWRRLRTLLEPLPESNEVNELGVAACLGVLDNSWGSEIGEEEAATLLAEGTRLAERVGDQSSPALLNAFYSRARASRGDAHGWLRYAEKGASLARESGDPLLQLRVLPHLGNALVFQSATRSIDVVQTALDRAPALDSLVAGSVEHHAYVNALRLLSSSLRFVGRLNEAQTAAQRVLQLAQDCGYSDLILHIQQQLGLIAEHKGDVEVGLRHARRAVESAERLDTPGARVTAYHVLSRVHAYAQDWPAALEAAETARETSGAHGTAVALGVGYLPVLVDAYRALGDFDRAFEILHDALDPNWALPTGRLNLARARLLRAAHGDDAMAEIERALDAAGAELERIDWHAYVPELLVERAALARMRGNEEERLQHLREAHRLSNEIGAPLRAERIARELDA
jgi:predicted ATPase/class 3 adenylate cyclase